MRLCIASFTAKGAALGRDLADRWPGEAAHTRIGGDISLSEWTAAHFQRGNGLVFVGAAGIAVRAVAPHLADKTADPAVVVLDERGRYVVPLLSGHIGGANQLAEALARYTGGVTVLTTATDVEGLFAVDSWAVHQGFRIANPHRIKAVSSRLLDGETVSLHSDFPIEGICPEGVRLSGEDALVAVSCRPQPEQVLHLVPPCVTVGVGCRKGVSADSIGAAVNAALAQADVHPLAVARVCSVDLKAHEPGLLALCRERAWLLATYSAQELAAVEGDFSASDFVRETVGVDNVCERAAVLGSGGRLLLPKQAAEGVAVALAMGRCQIAF